MKGKNRPSRRHRKKQANIIEERKPSIKQRMREQVGAGWWCLLVLRCVLPLALLVSHPEIQRGPPPHGQVSLL